MDRQEAIERIKQNKAAAEYFAQTMGNYGLAENELKDIEAFNMAIKALQDDWTPVSEGLPEDGVAVLTTTENKEVYIDQVITDPYGERYFLSNTGYDNFQVVAWRPLPEQYKENEGI